MLNYRDQYGFTLIELIAAIAIVGIVGVPLLGLFASSMENNIESENRLSSVAVAQGFMEFYKAGKAKQILAGKTAGETVTLYLLYKDGHDNIPDTLNSYFPSDRTYYIDTDPGSEFYDDIIDKRFKGSSYKYDFIAKTVLTLKDTNLVEISVTVWSSTNKESSRTNLISLGSF